MRVIAISGKKRSGKDTIATYINSKVDNTFPVYQFAYPIKRLLYEAWLKASGEYYTPAILSFDDWAGDGVDRELDLDIDRLFAKCVLTNAVNVITGSLLTARVMPNFYMMQQIRDRIDSCVQGCDVYTIRWFLQTLGEDIVNSLISPLLWSDLMIETIQTAKDDGHGAVIITDLRYDHELTMLCNSSSVIDSVDLLKVVNKNTQTNDQHISEHSLTETDYGFNIDNSGSLDDLYREIDLIFKGDLYDY